MQIRSALAVGAGAALALMSAADRANAVITIGPRSILATSEYQSGGRGEYIGFWGNFTGMPIGPRYFITANHIGDAGSAGFFNYYDGGTTLRTYSATFAGRQDDLAIWQLAPTSPSFTHWAPLYSGSAETGRPITIIGRGTDKGAEVRYPQGTGELRGWQWGTYDTAVTGGTNTVTQVFNFDGAPAGFAGDYLVSEFNSSGGNSECILSSGDSGGAVFMIDPVDSVKKLVAINSLTDGSYAYSSTGPFFGAAILDMRGFYVGDTSGSQFVPLTDPVTPASSYCTRISSRMTFIRSIIGTSTCGSADFNHDGDSGTDADIEAFFACIAGACCATCDSADFNGDGDTGTDADIEAFFRVLGGGPC